VAIAAGTAVRSAVLTDFATTSFAAGDIVAIHLQAAAAATKVVFEMELSLT
jgi:hypothetical protein